jgi:response regulator RpfG family c-di-GMP phosphodiesterase
MAFVLTIIKNPKESEILRLFFESISIKVQQIEPTYSACVKLTQYKPSFILIEIPSKYVEVINFLESVKKNKLTKTIYIIAYGNHKDKREIDGFKEAGVNTYIQRPLKTSFLKKKIDMLVHPDELKKSNVS